MKAFGNAVLAFWRFFTEKFGPDSKAKRLGGPPSILGQVKSNAISFRRCHAAAQALRKHTKSGYDTHLGISASLLGKTQVYDA